MQRSQRAHAKCATAHDAGLLAAVLSPSALCMARPHAHRIDETQPEYLKIRLRAIPKSQRSPPA